MKKMLALLCGVDNNKPIESKHTHGETAMNNQQIIEALVAKLTSRIQHRMEMMEVSYAEAKAYVADSSVAGPAVWKILDEKFAK